MGTVRSRDEGLEELKARLAEAETLLQELECENPNRGAPDDEHEAKIFDLRRLVASCRDMLARRPSGAN